MKNTLGFAALIALILPLGACGFHPVYATRGADGALVAEDLNKIAVDNIPDRQGQELRNELIDRMYGKGRPAQPAYHLTVRLNTNEEDLGLLANSTSTLGRIDATGNYTLTDAKGKVLTNGTAHSVTSFERLDNQYATLAASQSAIDRTVGELSEQITNYISLYFAERPASDNGMIQKATDGKVDADVYNEENTPLK